MNTSVEMRKREETGGRGREGKKIQRPRKKDYEVKEKERKRKGRKEDGK